MKKGLFILLVLTFNFAYSLEQKEFKNLHKIFLKGKYGFINHEGDIIIAPKYTEANDFTEGLAAVRINGKFGYINSQGDFIIQPIYDSAEPFSEGWAIVQHKGNQNYINKKGKFLLDKKHVRLAPFKNGRAFVYYRSFIREKFDIIDTTGKLVSSTPFSKVGDFKNGLAIVEGHNHNVRLAKDKATRIEIGVIDTLGNFLIPYGNYKKISRNNNDLFLAYTIDSHEYGHSKEALVLNKKNDTLFHFIQTDFPRFSAVVGLGGDSIVRVKFKSRLIGKSNLTEEYEDFMDFEGNLLLKSKSYKKTFSFSSGKGILHKDRDQYYIVDKNFHVKKLDSVSYTFNKTFSNDKLIVRDDFFSNGKNGIIDTSGSFVIPPFINNSSIRMVGDDLFIYAVYDDTDPKQNKLLYGLGNFKEAKIITPAFMDFCSWDGFKNELMECVIKNRQAYINKRGETVYVSDETKDQKHIRHLNITYMRRSSFYANSPYKDKEKEKGGYAHSETNPSPVTLDKKDKALKQNLSVVVSKKSDELINDEFYAHKVSVINNSSKDIAFDAIDSRLKMIVQAKNKKGTWADIEYIGHSWCGNSYHGLILPSQHKWNLKTYAYDGDFDTTLRIVLYHLNKVGGKNEIKVVSNEFSGQINLSQFIKK